MASLLAVISMWHEETSNSVGESCLPTILYFTNIKKGMLYYFFWLRQLKIEFSCWFLLFGYVDEIAGISVYFKFSLKISNIQNTVIVKMFSPQARITKSLNTKILKYHKTKPELVPSSIYINPILSFPFLTISAYKQSLGGREYILLPHKVHCPFTFWWNNENNSLLRRAYELYVLEGACLERPFGISKYSYLTRTNADAAASFIKVYREHSWLCKRLQ